MAPPRGHFQYNPMNISKNLVMFPSCQGRRFMLTQNSSFEKNTAVGKLGFGFSTQQQCL